VAVGIAGARGDDGHPRSDRGEERIGGRGPRAVVRDLEQVDGGQTPRHELRVDPLLGVAHQQEPLRPDLAQQDDRDVVDRRPAVGRTLRHPVRVRPQDSKSNGVDRQPIAGR
jgi:hypothetical protein